MCGVLAHMAVVAAEGETVLLSQGLPGPRTHCQVGGCRFGQNHSGNGEGGV